MPSALRNVWGYFNYFAETVGSTVLILVLLLTLAALVILLISPRYRLILLWLSNIVLALAGSGHQGWDPNLPYGPISVAATLKFPFCIAFTMYGMFVAVRNRGAGQSITFLSVGLYVLLLVTCITSSFFWVAAGRITILLLYIVGVVHGACELTMVLGPQKMLRMWMWSSIVILIGCVLWTATHPGSAHLMGRYRAFAGNANAYAALSGAMMVPACWLACKPGRQKYVGWALVAFWALTGMMSGSRAGIAIHACCLVGLAFQLRRDARVAIVGLVSVVALAVLAIALVPEDSLARFSGAGLSSLDTRRENLQLAAQYIQESPIIGHGFGWLETDAGEAIFSSYLALLVDVGVVGALAVMAVVLMVPVASVIGSSDPVFKVERALLLAFVVGMLLNAAAEAWIIGVGGPQLWSFLVAEGMLAGMLKLTPNRAPPNVPRVWPYRETMPWPADLQSH